ncbi:GNAT family N-acetyltransferase [Streptomyces broussonetiae]|uniref:GNAT family N-acetyltransferase n=1 Tax=Streptomyces broussonetiae TaxID=2686304 RepID=A0A6I6NLZ1_9ACTN|nr:GNAT family N-acetyltransferase [Streptomyces broussonetiae]QHA09176.1 GNAT family N-acetyltransferase [Streptomyces broussonetiae]
MDEIVACLEADAAGSPALVLRPWRAADTTELVQLYRDGALRRWTDSAIDDEASAARWIRTQQRGWEAGERFAFAIAAMEAEGGTGQLAGHVVLKGVVPGASSAEVGYWTAAYARGRGVASGALQALTDWAFTTFAGDGLTRLELLHQVDNLASCRVAQKCRYELTKFLAAAPPAFPLEGHLHVRERDI